MTGYFYEGGHFVDNFWTSLVFEYGPYPAFISTFAAFFIFCFSFFIDSCRRWRFPALLVVLTLVLGSGLVVHGLKEVWGRPRPVQIVDFGGEYNYRPFYMPNFCHGEDAKFRGFPCGHASTGFFFLSFIYLGRRYRKRLLWWMGWILTCFMGVVLSVTRVVQGKHFFSDVVMSFLLMWLVVVILDKICCYELTYREK